MNNENSDTVINLKRVLIKIWEKKIIFIIVILISGFIGYYLHSLILKEFKISTNLKFVSSYQYTKIISKKIEFNEFLKFNKIDEINFKNPNLKFLIDMYANEIIKSNHKLGIEKINNLNINYLYNLIVNKKNFNNFIEKRDFFFISVNPNETVDNLFDNLSLNSKTNGQFIDVSLNYTENFKGNIFLEEYIAYSVKKFQTEIIEVSNAINEKILEAEAEAAEIEDKKKIQLLEDALIKLEEELEISKSIELMNNQYYSNNISRKSLLESLKDENFYDFKKGTKIIKGEIIKINKILDKIKILDKSEKEKILLKKIGKYLEFRDYLETIDKNNFQIFDLTVNLEQTNMISKFVYVVRAILIALFLIFFINFLLAIKKIKLITKI